MITTCGAGCPEIACQSPSRLSGKSDQFGESRKHIGTIINYYFSNNKLISVSYDLRDGRL